MCQLGMENNGQSCQLQIRESGTGKIYQLNGNSRAMRLYQSGTRKVAIQGTLTDDTTVVVSNTESM